MVELGRNILRYAMGIKEEFCEAWKVCTTVNRLTSLYDKGSPVLIDKLQEEGITPEKWHRLAITSIHPNRLTYSLGGFTYFITHGAIARINPE